MTTYSFSQLQQLLEQAGLGQAEAAIGAAIALAESGGNPIAVGDQGTSFGLWQIHLPAHPDVTQGCAEDPACAAAAAVRISSNGTNWNPWTTFATGAYQQYLNGNAPGGGSGSGGQDATLSSSNSTTGWFGITNPFDSIGQAVGGAIARGAYLLLGVALIFFGLILLIVGSIPWGKIAQQVPAAAAAGAA